MIEYPKIKNAYFRDQKTKKIDTNILCDEIFGSVKKWHWTEKIDGMNIRIMFDPIFDTLKFSGRTDNAVIPFDLTDRLAFLFKKEKLIKEFPVHHVTFYGEGYGGNIQNPMGARYSSRKDFILFDIKIGQYWLDFKDVYDIAASLFLDVVDVYEGIETLEEATEFVSTDCSSFLANGHKAEGLIGRTPFLDKAGRRVMCKIKHKDFINE